jgi:hypothetical protein
VEYALCDIFRFRVGDTNNRNQNFQFFYLVGEWFAIKDNNGMFWGDTNALYLCWDGGCLYICVCSKTH